MSEGKEVCVTCGSAEQLKKSLLKKDFCLRCSLCRAKTSSRRYIEAAMETVGDAEKLFWITKQLTERLMERLIYPATIYQTGTGILAVTPVDDEQAHAIIEVFNGLITGGKTQWERGLEGYHTDKINYTRDVHIMTPLAEKPWMGQLSIGNIPVPEGCRVDFEKVEVLAQAATTIRRPKLVCAEEQAEEEGVADE